MQTRRLPDTSASELVREALDETKQLVQIEVALAKAELRTQVTTAKVSAVAFSVALMTGILALAMGLVSLALAFSTGPLPALIIALTLLAVSIAAGVLGFMEFPRMPIPMTQKRLESDLRLIKEHIA